MSTRLFSMLSSLSCIVGVGMLSLSFSINPGPPPDPTMEQLHTFGVQYANGIMWGAWLQAVAPLLIVLFAFALVHLAGAVTRLSGWMTFCGGVLLVMVSLMETTFFLSALNTNLTTMGMISLDLIHAVQHFYFIAAAPALFLPLGIVIVSTRVLPRVFGYLALALGSAFVIVGVVTLPDLSLPLFAILLSVVQVLWWLGAAITLLVTRSHKQIQHAPIEAQRVAAQ